jgi:hypothetical protein
LPRFSKPSFPSQQSPVSGDAQKRYNGIFANHHDAVAIKRWLAYFSADGVKPGNDT